MNPRTALITGITGQDESYLAEHGRVELLRNMVNADMALVGKELERLQPDGQLTAGARRP